VHLSGQVDMWNHRVVARKVGEETYYGIHEVYYDSNGKPTVCTKDPVQPFGETLEELAIEIRYFAQALEKPVLDYDLFCDDEEQGG